jgi:DNA-binding SARP family transcriptional activator
VDFRILGPLQVSREGRPLDLGGHRQKVLVCLLLLHANEVRSAEQIIDVLWGEAAPATARKALQVSVSRLRQILGAGVLETRAPGYLIRVQDGELDLHRFERLVAQGKLALATDPGRAAVLLRKALTLWRGPALADVMYEPFAQAEAGQLEELRLSCLEERIEADLALGRHADLVGELEVLTDRHPYRERMSGRLMLALYRSGRQAEALEIYRRSRDRLVEELGIEPGQELRSLASRVLNQDPSLNWTAPPASAGEVIESADTFVGRERELADLRRGLDDARRGQSTLFLISGEPGIGKTALIEQFAARVPRARCSGVVRSLLGIWRRSGVLALGPVPTRPRTRIGARNAHQPTRHRRCGPGRAGPRVTSIRPGPTAATLRRCRRHAFPALRRRHDALARRGSHQAHRARPGGHARGGRVVASAIAFRGADSHRRAPAGDSDNAQQRPCCDRAVRRHPGGAGTSPTVPPHSPGRPLSGGGCRPCRCYARCRRPPRHWSTGSTRGQTATLSSSAK